MFSISPAYPCVLFKKYNTIAGIIYVEKKICDIYCVAKSLPAKRR